MKNNTLVKILVSLLVVFPSFVMAQNENDKEIFRAMKDELERNFKELQLSNERPCFLEYVLTTTKTNQVMASLGATQNKTENAISNMAGLHMLLGDFNMSSDFRHKIAFYGGQLGEEPDYNSIRRALWNSTDAAYKIELKNLTNIRAHYEKKPKSDGMENVPDFVKIPEITNTIIEIPSVPFDMTAWEKKAQQLSAIFSKYPDLFSTYVDVTVFEQTIYKVTNEGTILRYPQTYAHVLARASVRSKEEVVFNDQYFVVVPLEKNLPSMEQLVKNITTFAKNLSSYAKADLIEEPYDGPVLFIGEPVYEMVRFNTMSDFAMISGRPTVGKPRQMCWVGEMGDQVLNKNLTVRHYNKMDSYKGMPVYGGYPIDADGVKPEDGLLLLEKGVLKARITGRIPDIEDPKSTGNSRFGYSTRNINQQVAPGIIHITAEKSTKADKMKDLLIKEAKKQGLEYAYIFRQTKRVSHTPYIYRVDVKSGKESLVSNAKLESSIFIKDDNTLAISDREMVSNVFFHNNIISTFIHPESIILKDVRIDLLPIRSQAKRAIDND